MLDALILAGGSFKSETGEESQKALLNFKGRIMVDYVVKAIQGSNNISRLALVGQVAELQKYYEEDASLILAPAGEDMLQSILNGLQALKPQGLFLGASGDLPFLTVEAVDDFLEKCFQKEGYDLYYAIVPKSAAEAKFPGTKRTYVTLKDNTYTGGNLFLVRSEAVDTLLERGAKLLELRKNPLALGRQVGFDFILRFLLHLATVSEAEKRFSALLGIKGTAVETTYAEIGVDVDKPEDVTLVKTILEKN